VDDRSGISLGHGHVQSLQDQQPPRLTALLARQAVVATTGVERLHGPLESSPTLVTDNGSNFLARRFHVHIRDPLDQVRTRYRTPQQLGLLERLHKTLKEEEIGWDLYASPAHARDRLAAFRRRYNQVRPHWALAPIEGGDPLTPAQVYLEGRAIELPAWQGWARAAKEKLEERLQKDSGRAGKQEEKIAA